MIINKKKFSVQVDGKELNLAVVRPNVQVSTDAQLMHMKAFREAIEKGAFVRASLNSRLRDQSLWDDEKEEELVNAKNMLVEGELKLKKGGISIKSAKEIAIKMRIARHIIQQLMVDRDELDKATADYYADNVKFNYLVSQCTVYEDTGEKYYESYEDYQGRIGDQVAIRAADALGGVLYGLEDNWEEKLPENKFLKKHKFVNSDLRLVDKQGNLVDVNGRLVNEKGQLVNESGHRIDDEGNLLSDDGEYDIETAAFLDDEGRPIDEDGNLIVTEEPEAESRTE